jgi:hypothetical protein
LNIKDLSIFDFYLLKKITEVYKNVSLVNFDIDFANYEKPVENCSPLHHTDSVQISHSNFQDSSYDYEGDDIENVYDCIIYQNIENIMHKDIGDRIDENKDYTDEFHYLIHVRRVTAIIFTQ